MFCGVQPRSDYRWFLAVLSSKLYPKEESMKKHLMRFWDSDARTWRLSIPSKDDRGVVWVRYDDLCEAFPGFKEIYTPEPDEPRGEEDDDQ